MLRAVLPLSFIAASRFFGLFIVLPVLSLYASKLNGANEFLIGLIIGAYALTQAFFQLPFGRLSDKVGRKKALALGLVIFIIGSLVCALASDIYTMILGRVLQGVGAVGGVASAMVADFSPENSRSKAMAMMGAMIGLSFLLAMLCSPWLAANFGLPSLFYISAGLSLFCIVLLFSLVPSEVKSISITQKVGLKKLLTQKNLLIMNLTSLFQKALTSVVFLVVPIILVQDYSLAANKLWKVYAPASIFGFLAMGVGGALGDGKGLAKQLLLIGVALFALSFALFFISKTWLIFFAGVIVFFVGFNLHEPIMQSVASKLCLNTQKGEALSLFSTFGFLGSFLGGALGGVILGAFGSYALFAFGVFLCIGWFILLLGLKNPSEFKLMRLDLAQLQKVSRLTRVRGIFDIYANKNEVIIKYDTKLLNEGQIQAML